MFCFRRGARRRVVAPARDMVVGAIEDLKLGQPVAGTHEHSRGAGRSWAAKCAVGLSDSQPRHAGWPVEFRHGCRDRASGLRMWRGTISRRATATPAGDLEEKRTAARSPGPRGRGKPAVVKRARRRRRERLNAPTPISRSPSPYRIISSPALRRRLLQERSFGSNGASAVGTRTGKPLQSRNRRRR